MLYAYQNPNSEDKEIRLDGLFSDSVDSVLVELNSVKQKIADAEAEKSDTEGEKKTSSEKLEEQREANYEYIVANGTIIPMEQDREQNMDLANGSFDFWSANDTTFEDFAVCAGWNDPQVLKKVQLMN